VRRAAGSVLAIAIALTAAHTPTASAHPESRIVGEFVSRSATIARVLPPPSMRRCLKRFNARCYRPTQLRTAYDVGSLLRSHAGGHAHTIVILDSFGSPTIRSDLRIFDRTFHLPDPPSFHIYQPAGRVRRFNTRSQSMLGWAAETTLDVEWSHVFAPGAGIVLLETPNDETEGLNGMPQMMASVRWALRHVPRASVISMSFGATEQTFPSKRSILRLRGPFEDAVRHGVGLVSATGDTGATLPESRTRGLFPFRVSEWPASDPLVLAAGGTRIKLNARGHRLSPDSVWHDHGGASGGGLSSVFARPGYQSRLRGIVGRRRGLPDISMSAADSAANDTYWSFIHHRPTWALMAGTSMATAELAGVVADAASLSTRTIGDLPARVYQVATRPHRGIEDITRGNNSFGPFRNRDGSVHFVRGFAATRGFDLASGLGTIDVARFARALAAGR
jgi:subtilase family serine protease